MGIHKQFNFKNLNGIIPPKLNESNIEILIV